MKKNNKDLDEVKKVEVNFQKKKTYKIILFVVLLILLATGITTGVFFYLQKDSQRDAIDNITYLGILEDGTYYIPKAKKNIRFQIDSLDTNSYNLTDEDNNKVETTIVEKNGKNLIQANENYEEGEIYTLELVETSFSEERLKDAKKLKFRIEEPEKAEYKLSEEVQIIEDEKSIQIQETEIGTTIQVPNKELEKNEIILVKDNEKENHLEAAYKIEDVENGVATVSTAQIADIYEELDLYHEEVVNFDELEINEEFKDQIELGVKKSALYQFLVNESYAADNIDIKPKIIQDGNKLKIEINMTIKANGQEFLGIKALTNHDLTLKFLIDLQAMFIENAEKNEDIGIDMALKQGYEFQIELTSNQTILEGVDELSDEEYCKTVQDIIAKLEGATEDKTEGKMPIGGIEVPTNIPFVNAYFDIYFQTQLGLQISLTYNQRVEMTQYVGVIMNEEGFTPYMNVNTPISTAKLTALGKAEMRFGMGFDVGISFGSKDLAYVGIGNEAGIYGEIFATMYTDYSSTNQHINESFAGKIEAGIYFKTKFSAGFDIFFIEKDYQKDLNDIKIPFLKIGTDEITTRIKANPSTVAISNNSIPVPTITKVMKNFSEGTEREETCENVIFKDANGNVISRVGNLLNYGKNEDTTIIAVYEEDGRVYKIEIKVEKQGAQTTNNQTVEVFANSQNKEMENIYKEYIRNKKYEKYSKNWTLSAESYCIYDINQDGIEELLIMSGNDGGWRNTLICSYNKATKQVIEIQDIYSYDELRYSVETKEIVYAELRPYRDVGIYGFHQLIDNKIVLSKATGWDGEGQYFTNIEGVGKSSITEEEHSAQFKSLGYFKFSKITDI